MPEYDVFLSHNKDDKPSVEAVAHRLREAGIQSWLDTWNLIPGEPWMEAIEQALQECSSCAVFIGTSGTGPWQNEEMRAAIKRRVDERGKRFRVIPVLLPGAECGERHRLPLFLTRTTWVQFDGSLDDKDALYRLICGIRGIAPGPESASKGLEDQCPYRGLQFFDVQHAAFFFGREGLTQRLLHELQPHLWHSEDRFLAIVGPSGSGKSSLARAGLVAGLKGDAIAGSMEWPIAIVRPGTSPLMSLAVALSVTLGMADDPSNVTDLYVSLKEDERTLHRTVSQALRSAPSDRRLVILEDQFEELFTLCADDSSREALIDNLCYAATVPQGQTAVVLTMRADFYGHCAQYRLLAELLSKHQILIGPMEADQLRASIERPAQLVGLAFEPRLVQMLLSDVRGQSGSLPLLQHALLELWEQRQGQQLTVAAYHAIGGVAGALERRAEAVYHALDEPEHEVCRQVLLRLIEPGESREDTKRRVELKELLPAQESRATQTKTVVQKLADETARLVTMEDEDNPSGRRYVELAHEALIHSWGRLRVWIDQDRAALRIRRRLTESGTEWERNNCDESYLYRGARLAEAEEWATMRNEDLNPQEYAFLTASIALRDVLGQEEQRQKQEKLDQARRLAAEQQKRAEDQAQAASQLRKRALYLGVALIVAVIAFVFAFAALIGAGWFWMQAEDSASVARSEAERANSAEQLAYARLLVAQGQTVFEEQPLLGLRLALEGPMHIPLGESDTKALMADSVRELAKWGRLSRLGDDIENLHASPDGSVIVLDRAGGPGQLHRTADGALLEILPGEIGTVWFSADANRTRSVLDYEDAPAQLRRTSDGALVATLSGEIDHQKYTQRVVFSSNPDADYFVVDYRDIPGELRRTVDGSLVQVLSDKVEWLGVSFSQDQDASYLAIVYEWAPGEVRRTTDGSLIYTLSRRGGSISFSQDPEASYFVIDYYGAPGELHRTHDGALITTLEGEIVELDFSPDAMAKYLIVDYYAAPDELRYTEDGGLIASLSGELDNVRFNKDASQVLINYRDKAGELRRTEDGAILETLTGQLDHNGFANNLPFGLNEAETYFAVDYQNDPGELRRTSDGAVVDILPGPISSMHFASGSMAYFVMDYQSAPGQLRRTVDGTLIEPLPGEIDWVFFDPAAASFVIDYSEAPGEVRWIVDGSRPQTLSGDVYSVQFSPDKDAAFFVVDYENVPDELRRSADGALLQIFSGKVSQSGLYFSADSTHLVVGYGDGRSELWELTNIPRLLARLGLGVRNKVFDLENRRLVLGYSDGRAYLLDLEWLHTMGGNPAAISLEELMLIICEGPLASDMFHEAALEPYLEGREAKACR